MKKNQYCIIKTTCKSKKEAKNLTGILLAEKLIACAQINAILSLYNWENKIQEEKEFLISFKAKSYDYKKIEKVITKNHSYKIPQIVKIDLSDGLDDYFSWIEGSVNHLHQLP